ncbi:MAG: ABC transporter ATP-binding protein [Planctomycetes bacterium]|nr:ABC transporter ATP-binding protein [Planctomycetota bacterium]
MTTTTVKPSPIARFQHVTKWYGAVIGVNEVSVDLVPGITGLLGPNGAGKTTFIKLLTGQLKPSLGTVLVRDYPAHSAAAKRFIGFCPDTDVLYEEMSGRNFVLTMALLHGLDRHTARERTEAALAEVDMLDRADRTLRGCSKGMRQRIKLAQSLVHHPDLLIVDEPLNGVDPVGRRELMDFFHRFCERGKAVLVSSHILEEMDKLAEQVIFMGNGRVLAQGTLAEIREMLAEQPQRVRIRSPQARELATHLIAWAHVQGVEFAHDDELHLKILQPEAFFRQFSELIVTHWFELTSVETTDVSAEAIFDYVIRAAGLGI